MATDEHNALSGPLEATYCPQVLAHYPENVAWNPFDGSAVTTVCYVINIEYKNLFKTIIFNI